jgi:hypothetical protein
MQLCTVAKSFQEKLSAAIWACAIEQRLSAQKKVLRCNYRGARQWNFNALFRIFNQETSC